MIDTNMPPIKFQLKEKAIALRHEGFTYREILAEVPVAKSTLSLWLQSVGLSKKQKQRITQKRLDAAKRGGIIRRNQRLELTKIILEKSQSEIKEITAKEFWLMGIMLYWAEGSKEKIHSSNVEFTNMDVEMICLFLKWINTVFHKGPDDLTISLTIHNLHKGRTEEITNFWIQKIKQPIHYIYYKKGNPKTLRKNIGPSYHGILRISIKASSHLNRQIAGWTAGVVKYFR